MPNGFRASVPPIVGRPSPFGLLGGCTEVITTTDLHELNGTQTLSLSCAESNVWYQCDATQGGTTPTNPASKTFDRPRVCVAEPVTVYSGVECSTFGMTFEEGQIRALEQLRMGEQRALEDHFMRNWLCPTAAGNDLTPAAGALHIAQGIGVLEGWLAQNWGGQGVLHIPAGAAALMSMHSLVDFVTETTSPTTLMGNCVVLGAGYMANVGPATPPATGCTAAPAGEMWIYATPPVRIRRDERVLMQSAEWQSVNTSINDRRALAETTFVPEVACCMAAAVRVSLAACP
jgi:hypothetical protein